MTVLRYNVGRQPPTLDELRAMRRRAEALDAERYGSTGPATCPMCGGSFWSWNRSQVLACPSCNPPVRLEPANGRPHLPEHMLDTAGRRPRPHDEAARRRAAERSRAYRARLRMGRR